ARGYLATHEDIPEISTALDELSTGNFYASTVVSRRLLENLANGRTRSATSELTALSDRELQVFSLIGRGFGASRLASELHLSVKTVETHQSHLKQKLGLHSATELSDKASRWMLDSMRRNLQLKKLLKAVGRLSHR